MKFKLMHAYLANVCRAATHYPTTPPATPSASQSNTIQPHPFYQNGATIFFGIHFAPLRLQLLDYKTRPGSIILGNDPNFICGCLSGPVKRDPALFTGHTETVLDAEVGQSPPPSH